MKALGLGFKTLPDFSETRECSGTPGRSELVHWAAKLLLEFKVHGFPKHECNPKIKKQTPKPPISLHWDHWGMQPQKLLQLFCHSFGGTARDFRFGTSTGNVAGIFAMSSKQSRRYFRCRPSFPLKYAQRHKSDDFLNMRFFGCLMLSLLNHSVFLAHGWKLTCETCQGFLPGVSIPPSKATVWKVINSTRVVKPSKHIHTSWH